VHETETFICGQVPKQVPFRWKQDRFEAGKSAVDTNASLPRRI